MPPVFILKDETLTFELQSQSLRIRMNKRTNERMKELTNERVRECKGSSSQSQVFQSQTMLQTIRSVKKSQKMSSLKNPIEMSDGKIF